MRFILVVVRGSKIYIAALLPKWDCNDSDMLYFRMQGRVVQNTYYGGIKDTYIQDAAVLKRDKMMASIKIKGFGCCVYVFEEKDFK